MKRILQAIIWMFITWWMPAEGQSEMERDRDFGHKAAFIVSVFVSVVVFIVIYLKEG